MAIDESKLPPPDLRGYEISVSGRVLRILLRRDIDSNRGLDRWATGISRSCVGPFDRVEVHVSGMVMLSSTIIAGLVHITDHFARHGCPRLTIVGACGRIVRSLQMMQLDKLFDFEAVEAA